MIYSKIIIIIATLMLSSLSLRANEERFTNTTLEILEYFQNLPKEALAHSKVDLNKVFAYVKYGSFKIQCARDNELYYLKVNKKLAFVFPETSYTVDIDCTDESKKSWNQFYLWQTNNNYIFFIHQVLRVMNLEKNDNDFALSNSLINTNIFFKELVNKNIANLFLNPDQAGCGLYLTKVKKRRNIEIFMEFRYKEKVLIKIYYSSFKKKYADGWARHFLDQYLTSDNYFNERAKVFMLYKNICL